MVYIQISARDTCDQSLTNLTMKLRYAQFLLRIERKLKQQAESVVWLKLQDKSGGHLWSMVDIQLYQLSIACCFQTSY